MNSIKQITPALVIVGILNTSKTLPRGLNSDNQIILSSLIVTFVVHYFKCQKGKELGLDEEAQAEPVRRSKNDTHDIEGTETVHTTVPKRSVDPRCIPKPFVLAPLPSSISQKRITALKN